MSKPNHIRLNFFLFSLLLLVSACHKSDYVAEGTVIAQVGAEKLTYQEVDNSIPDFLVNSERVKAIVNKRDEWVKTQVLVQEALRKRLDFRPEIVERLKKLRDESLAQMLKEYWLRSSDSIIVNREEAQAYYEKNKGQFLLNEDHVRYLHIQTADLNNSRDAKSAIMRGLPLNKVIEKYALDKTITFSKSKQFWPISIAAAEFDALNRYLQVIGISEISPIRLLDGRYHFVQLLERRNKGEHPDIEWVLDRIKDWLVLEKRRKLLSSLERELYLKANVSNEIKLYDIPN